MAENTVSTGSTMSERSDLTCDVVVVGCGVGGLYTVLNLPATDRVILLSKGAVEECDSMLAQGGICVLPEAADYDAFFADTMRAGHDENRRESVDIMIRSSRAVNNDLVALGTDFEREPDGSLAFTREGAHSRPRICFHADITGKEITTTLLAAVRRLPNVRIMEHTAMIDLLVEDGACQGIRAVAVPEAESTETSSELERRADGRAAGMGGRPADGAVATADAVSTGPAVRGTDASPFAIRAPHTVLATGGIGGVYDHSTNYPQLTGDACILAAKYGIQMDHLDYVQIHPTGLYSEKPGRTFLISESCRGEGAVLLDADGERFTDELQPRDVVSNAIREQMRADGTEHEWLSFAPVDPEVVRGHFTNIREHCIEEEGRDILEDPIPVVPTQHYFMGGVHVDRDGATTMPRLYAVGETACNGVHGKNRLASNSLLESLVWARRAAYRIATGASEPVEAVGEPPLDGRHRPTGVPGAAIDVLCADAQG